MRQDDLLHVVGHEEVVESAALVPLHEGLLGPGRTTADERRHDCGTGLCGQRMLALPVLDISFDGLHPDIWGEVTKPSEDDPAGSLQGHNGTAGCW